MDLNSVLKVGISAAKEAGLYLLNQQHQVKVITQKSTHDWLLEQDKQSEKIIISKIKETFPTHSILAEESGNSIEDATYQWIIDPLDGSLSYQHGWPLYGTVIGFKIDGIVKVSVIFLPFFNDLYTAINEEGAYLNEKRIQVSKEDDLNKSVILMADFSADGNEENIGLQVSDMAKLAKNVSCIRITGSAAVNQVYVASGRADALIARGSKPWDVEIGQKIIEEAGGKGTLYKNDLGGLFIFSNGKLNNKITSLIT